MKKIITIEAATVHSNKVEQPKFTKRRVAGYARVSTDHEEQATSYDAQMRYYTDYISSRLDWEFVKMYSDEGITGTNTKQRVGFNSMVNDALAGKIDLIITKSVSRFARNTVDSLSTVRKLKDSGVEIYFEKENIWTFDAKGELLITIMSSLAQEESRSISENVTWGKRKQYERGKVSIPFKNVLGFERGPNGELVVNEEEAKIVRYIFHEFLLGKNANSIAKTLTEQGIPSPTGKEKWYYGTVRRMLQNEKYKGDALLQKSFTTNFLTKKTKVNEGELPQYYVENNHEAIIDKDTFDLVQYELKIRERRGSGSQFSGMLVCATCGAVYGSKVWHSNSKYRRVIYRCNQKYEGEVKCDTPHVTDEEVKEWFVIATNKLIENKDEVIENMKVLLVMCSDTEDIQQEISASETRMVELTDLVDSLIYENSRVVQDQKTYQEKYDRYSQEYKELEQKLETLTNSLHKKKSQAKSIKEFIQHLSNRDLVSEFDEKLWYTMVEKVIIASKEEVDFHFKNGAVISI